MAEVTRVAVVGAGGRMGGQVCRAVESAPGLELVGRYDIGDDLADLSGAQVVVEFTVPGASFDNVVACVERGAHVVVGTTGWTAEKVAALREQVDAHPGVGVLIAPNFALGAVLMMAFAAQAARFYESVEIIELHHPQKVDAPSGTAARTASLIAAARAEAGPRAGTGRDRDGPGRRPWRAGRRHSRPRGSAAGTRRPSGGPLRGRGRDPDDPP